MEPVYAFGVHLIEKLQQSFVDYEDFFSAVNNFADPHYSLTHIFPLIAILDSVFASEFLLVTSIGEWLNALLKWIFMEHRPYWWVKETQYYGPLRANKPLLRGGPQTCETGPGSPSGHVMSASSMLALMVCWIIAIRAASRNNGKSEPWLKRSLWGVSAILIVLIMMARMFVATHFPHQCLLGLVLGLLTTYFVTNHLVTPYLNLEEDYKNKHAGQEASNARLTKCSYMRVLRFNMALHIVLTGVMILAAFSLYWGLKFLGYDPLWSVKLAFKWCPAPEFLHYNTTPLYTFVEATGSVLGAAICITPSVKRYNTKSRSLLISIMSAILFQQIFEQWEASIDRSSAPYFYLMNFFQYALRPIFFLRVVPMLATCRNKWKDVKTETDNNIQSTKKDD